MGGGTASPTFPAATNPQLAYEGALYGIREGALFNFESSCCDSHGGGGQLKAGLFGDGVVKWRKGAIDLSGTAMVEKNWTSLHSCLFRVERANPAD